MRDPGQPRRNPFFEHGSDGAADDPGIGWRDPGEDDRPGSAPGPDASGFTGLLALVEGLSDASPEAAEHLVAAAHEVVLAVKVLVDATEAVLADQRATMAERRAADAAEATEATDATDFGDSAAAADVMDLASARRAEGS